MDESSEALMETDVSSTTADVPEIQEVTGSHGMETVIVVEKLDDEESNSFELKSPNDSHQLLQEDDVNKPIISNADQYLEKQLQEELQVSTHNKVSNNEKMTEILPLNETSPHNSPGKQISPQNLGLKGLNLIVKSPVKLQKAQENADSTNTSATPEKEAGGIEKTNVENCMDEVPTKEIQPMDTSEDVTEDIASSSSQNADSSKQDEGMTLTVQVEVENDVSNVEDEKMDISEKEHNRSISRELKSLINSAKESKIISECTQLTSKTRKSRGGVEISNTSFNSTLEPEKVQGVRRNSSNSQISNCSEKSDKTSSQRSMRSQNPEFASKVKMFLNSVTGKTSKNESIENNHLEISEMVQEESNGEKKKTKLSLEINSGTKSKLRTDPYCWRCHWALVMAGTEKSSPAINCTVCPRSYHQKCLSGSERSKISSKTNLVCPECLLVLHAESSETRSLAMKKISLGMLCDLLKFALQRMMDINGVEPFMNPVDRTAFPDYDKYVVYPMDLTLMQKNLSNGNYGSTEAFLSDAQWILHNSVIFNTMQSKLTAGARALVRSCRAEMGEIEACPECYAAAHARRPTWFTDVCSTPHILLWAKLKGFPYWPAKAMSVNNIGQVDVRFFGAHDRAWVPAKDCFLYSEKDPNNFRSKRQDIIDSMQEAEQHICNISRKYGKFVYPPFKTQFDSTKLEEQLKIMIPSFEGEVRPPMKSKGSPNLAKNKSRSNSKSSISNNDGEYSEGEDKPMPSSRKMADGAEIALDEDHYQSSPEKEKSLAVDTADTPEKRISRKRRRSQLEEAVLTVIEIGKEKRRRVEENEEQRNSKTGSESLELTSSSSKEISADRVLKTPQKSEMEVTPQKSEMVLTKEKESSSVDQDTIPTNTSAEEKSLRVTPIKLILPNKSKKGTPNLNTDTSKSNKHTRKSSKDRSSSTIDVSTSNKEIPKSRERKGRDKSTLRNKSISKHESSYDKNKSQTSESSKKRRSSKSSKLSNSNNEKSDKSSDQKDDGSDTNQTKQKSKESSKEPDSIKSVSAKNTLSSETNDKDSNSKEPFDDDTSLAVIARKAIKNNVTSGNMSGLPTISSVRSLNKSELQKSESAKTTRSCSASKSNDTAVETSIDTSVFSPTSTNSPQNMKEAVNKLNKLRSDNDQKKVGRVGVKAFARIAPSPESQNKSDNPIEVEIKTEPIEIDDAERHSEKMDLMNAFKLRPVNPTAMLREVRINKVTAGPTVSQTKTPTTKVVEARPVAKKTFPQPIRKPDEGRSELNGKNSMVYIPIQPPMTQAPVRPIRPVMMSNANPTPIASRLQTPVINNTTKIVNSVSSAHLSSTMSAPVSSSSTVSSVVNVASSSSAQTMPTVGPAQVHTVPLITSVNGQWTFSLQPVMSVGGVDGAPSPPVVNGLPERNSLLPAGVIAPVASLPSLPPTPSVSTPIVSTSNPPMLQPIISTGPSVFPIRPAIDSTPVGEPPRLTQRPALLNPLDSTTPVGVVPPPSTAGPLTAKLNQNAVKLTDFFRNLLEDSLEKLDEPASQAATLRLQLEEARWRHQQEIKELKYNHELILAEMRSSFEKEKSHAISDMRRAAQMELEAAVKHAKSKQWCANCNQEAQFYCCWNTSYCDYPCQRAHWSNHFSVCTQQRSQNDSSGKDPSSSNPPECRLQQAPPENLQKSTSNVNSNKIPMAANSRTPPQKSSIILSMVEDPSGNQTMKCLGTYNKPSFDATQTQSLIINKQLLNNDDGTSKKVVTSGGYLIVGSNTPTTHARRVPPLQVPFFT